MFPSFLHPLHFFFFSPPPFVILKKQIVFLWVRPHFSLMEQLGPQVASNQQNIASSPCTAPYNRESKGQRDAICPSPFLQRVHLTHFWLVCFLVLFLQHWDLQLRLGSGFMAHQLFPWKSSFPRQSWGPRALGALGTKAVDSTNRLSYGQVLGKPTFLQFIH